MWNQEQFLATESAIFFVPLAMYELTYKFPYLYLDLKDALRSCLSSLRCSSRGWGQARRGAPFPAGSAPPRAGGEAAARAARPSREAGTRAGPAPGEAPPTGSPEQRWGRAWAAAPPVPSGLRGWDQREAEALGPGNEHFPAKAISCE